MKAKSIFALLTVLTISLASCKKGDDNNNNGGETPVKKLKYLSQLKTTGTDNLTTTATFTYDDKKRISTIKYPTSTVTYAYNGNQLFSVENDQPSTAFRDVVEFTYATDGTIASARKRTYRNTAPPVDVTYNFYYTAGKITQIKHEIYMDTYTYDSRGNCTKVFFDQYNFGNDYTYDDKPNSTTNGFPKYVLTSEVSNAATNNQTNRTGNTTTYTYDADGYPANATSVTPSGTVKYAYIYTEM